MKGRIAGGGGVGGGIGGGGGGAGRHAWVAPPVMPLEADSDGDVELEDEADGVHIQGETLQLEFSELKVWRIASRMRTEALQQEFSELKVTHMATRG